MKRKKRKLFNKLISLYTFTLTLTFLGSLVITFTVLRQDTLSKNKDTLIQHTHYLSTVVQDRNSINLNTYSKTNLIRITLVSRNGTVIFDSDKPSSTMENHVNRPEILEALEGEIGVSKRFSKTLRKEMLYLAIAYEDIILRTSKPIDNIFLQMKALLKQLFLAHIILWVLLLILTYNITRSITRPLKKLTSAIKQFSPGNSTTAIRVTSNDEIETLSEAFNEMIQRISEDIEKMKALENVRRDFVANVSHEIKTPLTTIKGFIETLENGTLEDKENNRRFLAIIKKNVDRLSALVSDVLKLSILENEETPQQKINCVNLVHQVLDDLNLRKSKLLELNLTEKKITLKANRDELYSAFLNYLDNAVKYAPNTALEVTLTKEQDSLVFSVQDQGPGIPPQHLKRIFERFYRPDNNRSRDTGGTGLGLSIVKHVVEKYDGTVQVSSTLGQGTCFSFKIPLKK